MRLIPSATTSLVKRYVWVPKPCVTWPDAPPTARPAACRAWDDLRLAGLKLIFLIVTRAMPLVGLPRREWWRKDAEILMLRHQLAVAQRERPPAHSRLTWPDPERGWRCLQGRRRRSAWRRCG